MLKESLQHNRSSTYSGASPDSKGFASESLLHGKPCSKYSYSASSLGRNESKPFAPLQACRNKKERGFQLLEAVIAGSVFLLVATALFGAYSYGSESAVTAGQRMRATYLAEEGLEATRNIRDANFTNLVNGTYGLSSIGTQYTLTGTSDTKDIFNRSIVISTVDAATKQVVSTVTWQETPQRTGTVALTTYLGNTGLLRLQSNNLVINTTAANIGGSGQRDLLGITLQNTGTASIIIDKVTVTYTGSSTINQVVIGGTTTWTGTQSSGTVVDITNYTIPSSTTVALTRLRFSGNMKSNTFTIIFTMTDGSTKSVTLSPP